MQASKTKHNKPFPGTRSYRTNESDLFFGRSQQVRELTSILEEKHFVAVTGPSGCGKSSLIHAGLIPTVLQANSQLQLVSFRPLGKPFENLVEQLQNKIEQPNGKPYNSNKLLHELVKSNDSLAKLLNPATEKAQKRWLIYIDQFEELFVNVDANNIDKHIAERFIYNLLHLVQVPNPNVYIIISLRSDFLGDCANYNGFPETLNQGNYLVPKLSKDDLHEVITGPLALFNAPIEPELVDQLLTDVQDNNDMVLILQHALMRTYDRWQESVVGQQPITMWHYNKTGGIQSAISVHGEEVFQSLGSDATKEGAEKVFRALVKVDADKKVNRNPASFGQICEISGLTTQQAEEVLNSFRAEECNFLTPAPNVPLEENTVVDISHESIVKIWKRLSNWIDEEVQSAETYLRLSNAAELYQTGKGGLWTNPELQLGLNWRKHHKPNATWATKYNPAFERAINFLDHSQNQHLQEQEHKEKLQKRNLMRARIFAFVLGGAFFISLLLSIVSLNLRFKAESSRKEALAKEQLAIDEKRKADMQRKEAVLQKKISEQQQQIAEQQKLITEEQREIAVEQQRRAQTQTMLAIAEKQKATVASHEALKARDEAQTQRQMALQQKQRAEKAKVLAETSEQKAKRMRLIAIARNMAIQAAQLNKTYKNDALPALLALKAFDFYRFNASGAVDPDIYRALAIVSGDQTILRPHNDGVRKVSFSAKGDQLASCGDDGAAYLWKGDYSGKKAPVALKTGGMGKKGIRTIQFSPGGAYLAGGTSLGQVLVWKGSEPEAVPLILKGHSGIADQMAFGAIDEHLFTAGNDHRLLFWNLASGNTARELDSLSTRINSIAFSRTHNALFYADHKGYVRRFSMDSFSKSVVLSTNAAIYSIAVSPNGKYLACGLKNGKILLYNLVTGGNRPEREIIGWHTSAVSAVRFVGNTGKLVSCSYDKQTKVGNVLDESAPIALSGHEQWVYDVEVSPNGQTIVTSSADKTIRVYSLDQYALAEKVKQRITRRLTESEWAKFVGEDIPYPKLELQ